MAEPFIFIHNATIKEGKLEGFRNYLHELVEVVQASEPRLIAFNVYVDDAASAISAVQVHPDAASMEFHLQTVGDKVGEAYEYLDTDSVAIYGTPSEPLLDMLKQLAGSGVAVNVKSGHAGGFTRPQAG